MTHRVLDERLQDERRDDRLPNIAGDVDLDAQPIPEPDTLDVEVLLDVVDLVREGASSRTGAVNVRRRKSLTRDSMRAASSFRRSVTRVDTALSELKRKCGLIW